MRIELINAIFLRLHYGIVIKRKKKKHPEILQQSGGSSRRKPGNLNGKKTGRKKQGEVQSRRKRLRHPSLARSRSKGWIIHKVWLLALEERSFERSFIEWVAQSFPTIVLLHGEVPLYTNESLLCNEYQIRQRRISAARITISAEKCVDKMKREARLTLPHTHTYTLKRTHPGCLLPLSTVSICRETIWNFNKAAIGSLSICYGA